MNNKLTNVLLAILTVSVGFLLFQNYTLGKRVNELASSKEEGKTLPVSAETQPVTLQEASPFDKPNDDPSVGKFLQQEAEPTTVKFEKMVHDFGKINEGAVAKTVFKFTNTGKNPLIISTAKGSCGCTVPQWPHHPVNPGATEEIAVEFNSAGKMGENQKTVTVTANTNPTNTILTIQSTVIPKDK